MTIELVQEYWALLIASVLGLTIALYLLYNAMKGSRRGRLVQALGHLRQREQALKQAIRATDKAEARYSKLSAKGDSMAPNKVLAAKDAVVAARETQRLLEDQVLVVRNDARKIILEEYPPNRHEAMLRKSLGESR